MNWRRGLFRAWLFLTTIWLVGFGYITYLELSSTYTPTLEYAYGLAGDPGPFRERLDAPRRIEYREAGELRDDPAIRIVQSDKRDLVIFLPDGLAPAEAKRRVKHVVDVAAADRAAELTKRRWEKAYGTIPAMFAVPVIIFIFGAGVVWVLSGFRSKSAASGTVSTEREG